MERKVYSKNQFKGIIRMEPRTIMRRGQEVVEMVAVSYTEAFKPTFGDALRSQLGIQQVA